MLHKFILIRYDIYWDDIFDKIWTYRNHNFTDVLKTLKFLVHNNMSIREREREGREREERERREREERERGERERREREGREREREKCVKSSKLESRV